MENYSLYKIMHKNGKANFGGANSKSVIKFQKLTYAVIAANIAATVLAILAILLLSGVIK